MSAFPTPVVATAGSMDPAAPLVVLLHGRGSNEDDIVALADHLPGACSYAAVRAPIAEGGGYAWFANRGIGRPVAASLRTTMDWFRTWLDAVAPAGRPVVLVGFSGGAAFAGGLLLDDPSRYVGAAILSGTLPFGAGVPTTPGRLIGVPVFVAQGQHDTVIPRELLDRTWAYLLGESGAPTTARRDPVAHAIAPQALAALGGWLQERLSFLVRRGHPDRGSTTWPTLPDGELPPRAGARPTVTSQLPQEQRSENAPADLVAKGWGVAHPLAGVRLTPGMVMLFGPRDVVELDIVTAVVAASHAYASGRLLVERAV